MVSVGRVEDGNIRAKKSMVNNKFRKMDSKDHMFQNRPYAFTYMMNKKRTFSLNLCCLQH